MTPNDTSYSDNLVFSSCSSREGIALIEPLVGPMAPLKSPFSQRTKNSSTSKRVLCQDINSSFYISSSFPNLEDSFIDNSPLPHKPSYFGHKYQHLQEQPDEEDDDVAMDSDNSSSSSSRSSIFTESEEDTFQRQGAFSFRNGKGLFSSQHSKPGLQHFHQVSSTTSISSQVSSNTSTTSSMTSIDSYFAFPPCVSSKSLSGNSVIPTKTLRRQVKSSLPPNTSALINAKPTLSWRSISHNTEDLKSFSLPRRCGPSKSSTSFTSHTATSTLSSLRESTLSTNEHPLNLTHISDKSSNPEFRPSWAMPSFRGGQHAGFDTPSFKPIVPLATPRFPRNCKVRRTHSMFEHPEDVLADEIKESIAVNEVAASSSPVTPLSGINSILNKPDCPIKTFDVKDDQFKRIDSSTLCEIMDGIYSSFYDRYLIIDCRFEYEYDGGHIEGAININTKERLEDVLLSQIPKNERVLLIFHCEYSAHRGPRMAMHLRNLDRQCNISRYPSLHYPDITILSGGYSHFFSQYNQRCFPQKYVGMNDTSHKITCEREMFRFKKAMRFSRSQNDCFKSSELSAFKFPLFSNSKNSYGETFSAIPENVIANDHMELDNSPLINASKSYSCFEFSNSFPNVSQRNNTLQTTPTSCNTQLRRKLGVKIKFTKFS